MPRSFCPLSFLEWLLFGMTGMSSKTGNGLCSSGTRYQRRNSVILLAYDCLDIVRLKLSRPFESKRLLY